LTYAFDFGDGTTTGPQAAATASHTYAAAGTYTVTVTVTDSSGLSDTASRTVVATSPTSTDPTYVGGIANNYSTSTHTSGYITVYKAAGVQAGDLVVLTLQLSGTATSGPVTGTDGSGNRLVVLSGVAVKPLVANDRLTVTFPSAATYRLSGDEFAGVSAPDQASTGSGATATFSSGAVQATTGHEIVYSAVALGNGSANPTWSGGWQAIGTYSTSTRYLGKAYQVASAPGSYTGTGGATGPWLAAAVTFRS
jgi:PKD repeat protein